MDFGEDNFETKVEVDPAADFLAREQNALAGLEDELPPVTVDSISQPTLIDATAGGLESSSGSFEVINNIGDHPEQSTTPVPTKAEPEKIRKWREEQKARLEEKDREEEKKKEELRLQAKKELEDWLKQTEDAITKTCAASRGNDKQDILENEVIEPGTEWERIAKLCEFNPKTNKSGKDVSRMRSILLQLKQNPLPVNNKNL